MKVRLVAIFAALVGIAAAITIAPGAHADSEPDPEIPVSETVNAAKRVIFKAMPAQVLTAERRDGAVFLSWEAGKLENSPNGDGGYYVSQQAEGETTFKRIGTVPKGTLTFSYADGADSDLYRLEAFLTHHLDDGFPLAVEAVSKPGPTASVVSSAEVTDTVGKPATPVNLNAVIGPRDGLQTLQLSWKAVPSADGYNILIDDDPMHSFDVTTSHERYAAWWSLSAIYKAENTPLSSLTESGGHTFRIVAYKYLDDGTRVLSDPSPAHKLPKIPSIASEPGAITGE